MKKQPNIPIFLILLAAGASKRYGRQKLLETLYGIPVFIHALKGFLQLSTLQHIVLVCPPRQHALYQTKLNSFITASERKGHPALAPSVRPQQPLSQKALTRLKTIHYVKGGKERFHSVANGLEALAEQGVTKDGIVLIHDGARPLIHKKDITSIVNATIQGWSKALGIIPGNTPSDTIKVIMSPSTVAQPTPEGKDKPLKAGEPIVRHLPRHLLRAVSTPQSFPFQPIYTSYQKLIRAEKNTKHKFVIPTDDSEVYMRYGFPVNIIPLQQGNMKLTWQNDLKVILKTFS